ncbi:MAG: class I SAM-dependent methyltransferase, partial [Duncaniella dubosii]
MQHRHKDRSQYFSELAYTSEKYFMPYIAGNMNLDRQLEILEIGCGDGGNLLPFAKSGHLVTGVDISTNRIKDATSFFQKERANGKFICSDIFETKFDKHFDL